MHKIYYLRTCNTCMRILKTINPPQKFTLQDIKEDEITVKQLKEMHALAGSYEALFSKRAKLYKEMGLKDMHLEDADYKHYILEHYTFLKRPVIIHNANIFIGNARAVIEESRKAIHS